jgi:phage baseplate assembly protein gpV
VLQTRQSDLGLLQELAAAAGLVLRLQETEIELIPASGDGHSVALDGVRDFVDLAVEENVSRAAGSVGVRGWNVGGTTAVRGEAAGQAGAPLAFSRLGVFCETDAAAQVFAEAEAARRKQEHVTVRGLAHGNAALRPGSSIELTGPDLPRTRVVLQSVTHTVDPTRGFLTEISSSAGAAPAMPAARGAPLEASLAEVTSVADPERQGRVKLRLLALGGLETGWMPVLLPGAGPNKGLFALPAPGDRVLVLLLGEHPVQGVVVGGLFGQNAPADHGIDGDAVKRFSLQTPGGQRVTLDDATRKLLLEQPDGASILLGPDEARLTGKDGSFLSMTGDTTVLHASGNLTLRAPGGKLKIAADAVDFEKL